MLQSVTIADLALALINQDISRREQMLICKQIFPKH